MMNFFLTSGFLFYAVEFETVPLADLLPDNVYAGIAHKINR